MQGSPTPDAQTAPLAQGVGCASAAVMCVGAFAGLYVDLRYDVRCAVAPVIAGLLLAGTLAARRAPVLDRAARPLWLLPQAALLATVTLQEITPADPMVFDSPGDLSFIFVLGMPIVALLVAGGTRPIVRWLLTRNRPRVFALIRGLAWIAAAAALTGLGLSLTRRPPLPFAVLAAAGALGALVLLARGHRSLLPADGRLCKNALPLADGTLLFPDDTPQLPLPDGAEVGTDPVVAIFAVPPGAYRDQARPRVVRVVPGTLAEHRLLAALTPHATALAVLAFTAAPLLAWLLA
jgi:hypothetical protein